MAKKPIGRRRADVRVNVLEQFELRSRKSVQAKFDAKRSRAEAKAAKSAERVALNTENPMHNLRVPALQEGDA